MDEPRLRHSRQFDFVSILLLLAVASPVPASPLISIGDGTATSWAAAAGNIRVAGTGVAANAPGVPNPGVLDPSTAAFQFYQDAIGTVMGGPPIQAVREAGVNLFADVPVSDGNDTFDSLVMSWDTDTDPSTLNVAAWDYVYDVDPNLNGRRISFSLLAPPGVWDFSLELFDALGNSMGWFGVPPGMSWASVVIDPSIQAAQGPFSAFHFGASGTFDLSQVIFIRLNESSQTGLNFVDLPIPGGPVVTGPWNAWNHLVVIPEPASLLLLAIGLLALVALRDRRMSDGRRPPRPRELRRRP